MKKEFIEHIKDKQLIGNQDKILLAVSGGIDSMCMLHLFMQSPYPFEIAHCNFQLRGADADADEAFMVEFAKANRLNLHHIRFNTKEYAQNSGLSTQMAARQLRYQWFEELAQKRQLNLIATAHHKDDIIETFFLNLVRKTGIAGLCGIKEKNGIIIRPMTFAGRKEIVKYVEDNAIPFREDCTNKSDHYLRNAIRHHIIPKFQELKPDFQKNIMGSITIISDQEKLYRTHIEDIKESIFIKKSDYLSLPIEKIQQLPHQQTYLFEFLSPYGLSFTQVQNLYKSMDGAEEKTFLSDTHKILKTRNSIEVHSLIALQKNIARIDSLDLSQFMAVGLEFELIDNHHDFQYHKDQSVAYFGLETLRFPLFVRTWKRGDYFYPIHGRGRKKISDFYTENKLSSIEKESTELLCNNDSSILWVIGYRSDQRFGVNSESKQILKIKRR